MRFVSKIPYESAWKTLHCSRSRVYRKRFERNLSSYRKKTLQTQTETACFVVYNLKDAEYLLLHIFIMHPTAIGVIVVLASIFWHAILGLFRAVRKWAILSRLPHPSSSSSLFGSFELIKDVDHIPQILTEVADRLGGIFSIRILGVSSVIVTDPELIDALLTLQKDPIIYGIMSCIVSPDGKTPHMLSHARNDGYWLKIRRQVLPAFSQSNVRKRFPSIVEKIERLCEILEAKHRCDPDLYFDVDNLFQRQALDVMAQIGFATEFGTMDRLHPLRAALARDGEKDHYTGSKTNGSSRDYESDVSIQDDIFQLFRAASTEVTLRANSAFRQTFRHVLPSARKGTKDLLEVQRRMKQFVNEVRERYGYRPPPEDDISVAAQLLRLSDMSDLQMAGEFTLFLYSGFETTGHAMAWTIYLLCRHPEASAEVLDQLNEMGLLKTKDRPNPRKVEYSDVLSLQRGALGRFIKETMRMIPVVSGGTGELH